MNFDEMNKQLKEMADKVKTQMPNLYKELGIVGERFVLQNFDNQSWESTAWEALKTPTGRNILHGVVPKLRNSFKTNLMPDGVEVYTNVLYAKAHNEGFKGRVNVKAHERSKFSNLGKGKKKKLSTGKVNGFSRNMNLKKRQFAPTDSYPSQTLQNEANKTIENFFKPILNLK